MTWSVCIWPKNSLLEFCFVLTSNWWHGQFLKRILLGLRQFHVSFHGIRLENSQIPKLNCKLEFKDTFDLETVIFKYSQIQTSSKSYTNITMRSVVFMSFDVRCRILCLLFQNEIYVYIKAALQTQCQVYLCNLQNQ